MREVYLFKKDYIVIRTRLSNKIKLSKHRLLVLTECVKHRVYLGSVHKYFGGGAGQLKIFVVKLV